MDTKRLQPTMKMIFPKRQPYEQVREYLFSLKGNQTVFKPFEYDKPGHTPELHLTATRRIYAKTEDRLRKARNKAAEARIYLDEQWKELADKEKEFRDSFINMNDFIKSNSVKRLRAQEHLADDRKVKEERIKAIEQLQVEMVKKQELKKQLEVQVALHKLYEQFLDNSLGESEGEFKHVDDFIARYEALVATRSELAKRQQNALMQLEMARAKTMKMAEEIAFVILGLNNKVATLNSRYQSALASARRWDVMVTTIKQQSSNRFMEINEVKRACYNIYLLMCRRKSQTPKVDQNDFENHLVFIKRTLQELDTITAAVKGTKSKKIASTKAETSKTPTTT